MPTIAVSSNNNNNNNIQPVTNKRNSQCDNDADPSTQQHMETPSTSELSEMLNTVETNKINDNNSSATVITLPFAEDIIPSTYLDDIQNENRPNEIAFLTKRLQRCTYQLDDERRKNQELRRQIASLNSNLDTARAEYEVKLAAQRGEISAKERQISRLRYEQECEERRQKFVDQELAAKLVPFIKNNNHKYTTSAHLLERLAAEIPSVRETVKIHSLATSREMLLKRILQLAIEQLDTQVKAISAHPSSVGNVHLSGYKSAENFLRNECLFSGVSSVEKSFFLKCPDHHLAAAIDPVTGKLNQDLFYFSFHGTKSLQAARGIQCEGYDPQKRASQAMGSGEYSSVGANMPGNEFFGVTTAVGYSAGLVLVNLIYKPPAEDVDGVFHEKLNPNRYRGAIKFHGPVAEFQGVLVIKNPPDRKDGTYMLPLGCMYNVDWLRQGPFGCEYKDEKGLFDPLKIAMGRRTCNCIKHSNKHNDDE